MKKEKNKSKESLIGKIIYGFLLFMPLLAIFLTCAYTIFNKNAYQNYSGNQIEEKTQINLENSNTNTTTRYYLNITSLSSANDESIYITNFKLEHNGNLSQSAIDNLNNYSDTILRLRNKPSTSVCDVYRYENDTSIWLAGISYANDCVFSFYTTTTHNTITQQLYYYEYHVSHYLDNVFYYSLNRTEESQYFNWAKNTALYTGVSEFTNTLGITTTYIPFLMTYWLLISVVYLIYDIALMMLHMAHKKIHQLEGSI